MVCKDLAISASASPQPIQVRGIEPSLLHHVNFTCTQKLAALRHESGAHVTIKFTDKAEAETRTTLVLHTPPLSLSFLELESSQPHCWGVRM